MGILHSKHQKLILQCYPPGKAVDKKPNPSELSYLLYYASTRRVKLEKVVAYLHSRTTSDTSRTRAGNLQVTLSILSALIEKCSENLNVFANEVCTILRLILKVHDVALRKSVLKTYGVLCEHLDGGLFSGDKEFVDSFTVLSQLLIDSAKETVAGPDLLDWKLISVLACEYVSNCIGFNIKVAKHFTTECIPLLLDIVKPNNSVQVLRERFHVNENELAGKSSQVRKDSVVTAIVHTETDVALTSQDVDEAAFTSLKSFFDTSLISQISASTNAVVKHTFNAQDCSWGRTVIEVCATWIPVQLRFVALSTLLTRLNSILDEASSKNPQYQSQIQYANYILGLVSSDVNMIGLSVSDIIQQLLSLQASVALHHSLFLSELEVHELLTVYSNCICNLSTHVYYFDQVPDSIQEILMKVDSVLEQSFPIQNPDITINTNATTLRSMNPVNGKNLKNLIITLLQNITIIFSILKKKPSTISRNYVLFEHWEISLGLLSPETDFEGFDPNILSPEDVSDIQIEYLQIFRDYIALEIFSNEEYDQSGSNEMISTENIVLESKTYLIPDTNNYISNSDNFITHFLAHVDKLFQKREPPNIELLMLVSHTLKDLSGLLGINFLSNYIPFFFHWILKSTESVLPNPADDESARARDTIAYGIMHDTMKVLNDKYQQIPNGYCYSSDFFIGIEEDIDYRRCNGLWDGRLVTCELSVAHQKESLSHNTTKKGFQMFVNGDAWLLSCINPYNALSLDTSRSYLRIDQHQDARNHHVPDFTLSSNSSIGSDFVLSPPTNSHSYSVGLGLGTAGDITSIHSGLNNGHFGSQSRNGYFDNNGSIASRQQISPRVSDLKDAMFQRDKIPAIQFGEKFNPSSAKSVLSRQLVQTDVDSILEGLDSDCDSEIVV